MPTGEDVSDEAATDVNNCESKNSNKFIYINIIFDILGAFRLYDVDNDGFITRDEMYNIVDAIYQMVVSYILHYQLF